MTTEIKIQIYREGGKFGTRYIQGKKELKNEYPKSTNDLISDFSKHMGEGDFSKIYSVEYTKEASEELDRLHSTNKLILEEMLGVRNNLIKRLEKIK